MMINRKEYQRPEVECVSIDTEISLFALSDSEDTNITTKPKPAPEYEENSISIWDSGMTTNDEM